MEFVGTHHKHPRNNKKLLTTLLVGAVITVCLLTFYLLRHKSSDKTEPVAINVQPLVEAPKEPTYENLEGRYLFNGTIVLARAVEKYAAGNFAQPFSKLATFEPEKYDAWAADFECPITTNVVPYERQIANLVFNCRPEWLPELTKYVQLFNLANNHTGDMGFPEGFNETREHLQQAGAQFFGNYDPTVITDICEVISLPVRLNSTGDSEGKKANLPVAFCSWHYFNFNRGPTAEELAPIKQYANVMPVFAFVEMGNEYQAIASPIQEAVARSIIDEGADFVFANNPHWVQNAESYKGKLIVYSLGNFIFDQIDAETQRGVSIDTTISVPYNANTAAWVQLGDSCKKFKDNCLAEAQSKGLKKLEYKLTYTPVASQGGAGKITTKASEVVQKAVEDRLNWSAVSVQLTK